MKATILFTALSVSAVALAAQPAIAQSWYDPQVLLRNSYAEVEGGASVQGRTKIGIEATGLGASAQSTSQDDDFLGGGLVGYSPMPGVSIEGEGLYYRDRLAYAPTNAVFGTGGATRTYGGLGNLKFSLPFTPQVMSFGLNPYIAAGIGYGNVQYTGRDGATSYRDDADGFIWQGKAGLDIKLYRNIGLDLAYRYLQSPDFHTAGAFHDYSILSRTHVQAVTLGLKYAF